MNIDTTPITKRSEITEQIPLNKDMNFLSMMRMTLIDHEIQQKISSCGQVDIYSYSISWKVLIPIFNFVYQQMNNYD